MPNGNEVPPAEKPVDPSVQEPKPELPHRRVDSFNVPVEKSPWLVYALLQIPIVIIMVVIVYFMYQQSQGN